MCCQKLISHHTSCSFTNFFDTFVVCFKSLFLLMHIACKSDLNNGKLIFKHSLESFGSCEIILMFCGYLRIPNVDELHITNTIQFLGLFVKFKASSEFCESMHDSLVLDPIFELIMHYITFKLQCHSTKTRWEKKCIKECTATQTSHQVIQVNFNILGREYCIQLPHN